MLPFEKRIWFLVVFCPPFPIVKAKKNVIDVSICVPELCLLGSSFWFLLIQRKPLAKEIPT